MRDNQADPGSCRAQVLHLMTQKDKIEGEIRQLTDILTQNGVGMTEPLVDAEGFPISSIDIYQVRHARHKICCLQNDHKAIMQRIENGLQGYYSASSSENSMDTQPINIHRRSEMNHQIPFAKVTQVSDGSPAFYAGIRVNDELVEFGTVNANNFKAITDIATVVQHSEGTQVNLKLKRNDRFLTVNLLPKKWLGRGLLGCNIVAI